MHKFEEILEQLLAEQRAQTELLRRALAVLEALPQRVVGTLQAGTAPPSSRVVQLRKQ